MNSNDNDKYDAEDDFRKSILEAFRVIRKRMASGGSKWEPHKYHPLTKVKDNEEISPNQPAKEPNR